MNLSNSNPTIAAIINSAICSGILACACGMSEWLVECKWTSERSVDGMNVILLHELCATQVEN